MIFAPHLALANSEARRLNSRIAVCRDVRRVLLGGFPERDGLIATADVAAEADWNPVCDGQHRHVLVRAK
jgi:hypothetical protein